MTRRRLSFSLRTLLAIVAMTALFLGWLQSEAQTVRERMAVLAKLTDGDEFFSEKYRARRKGDWGMCGLADNFPALPPSEAQLTEIRTAKEEIRRRELAAVPWWRKLLGDRQIDTIYCNSRSAERLEKLFPEAYVGTDDDLP